MVSFSQRPERPQKPPVEARPNTSTLLDPEDYDLAIVSFSGGKDSLSLVLHLLDIGFPKDKIELWHQAVDGRPGVDPRFFDWPCTESYCRAVAQALGLPIKFQWREGGMEGEITKVDRPTAPASFELPDGTIGTTGGKGEPNTRLMFPSPEKDLRKRWCSALLKADVCDAAINNDPRLKAANVLLLTGERREESDKRASFPQIEKHGSTTLRRRVDQWRAIINWPEERVWEAIERWRINPHPAYHLGWGRLSCMSCIFGDADQWASVRDLDPKLFKKILGYEHSFGRNVKMTKGDVEAWADRGKSFVPPDADMIRLAMSEDYPAELVIVPEGKWELPLGAYKRSGGPT
jgi:3'-phosphoadenosine 5'-phosphosulfate sulfotransferase (PAPS reductase)/FAD synthetase